MGWWIALGVLVLLAIVPIGVHFGYNSEGVRLRAIVGFVRITLLPKKKKKKDKSDKKEQKSLKKTKKKPSAEKKKTEEDAKEAGGSWTDFLPLVQLALKFLGDFRRKLRIKNLELKVILAQDDPCDLAVNYGKTWAAVGNLLPLLEQVFVIGKRNIEVECDFTADQTSVIARADLTITLGRAVGLAVVYGIRALREYFKIINKRKGGAEK